MDTISIKKLAEYCRDYVDLVAPSAMSRNNKRIILSDDVFSAEPLLSRVSEIDYDEQMILPINFMVDILDLADKDDVTIESKVDTVRNIQIAKDLDDVQRKFEDNYYTRQLVLEFGHVSFSAKPLENEDELITRDDGRVAVDDYLFSVPISINYRDSGGYRKYEILIDDNYIKTNIGFLRRYMKMGYREDLYKFIAQYMNDDCTEVPIDENYVDELWTKITTFLQFSEALEISKSPDMRNVVIVLEPKANYFLSQDLSGIIQNDNEAALRKTSLASWIDKEDEYINDHIEDNGEFDLFFPFAYDKYQLKVLSKINNKGIIVEGPPGTGKSQTIANILVHLGALGKKVLFVSQKDQAIRGVKDKLKSLDIPLLFGYIPDRSSKLHTEDDEKDGAAYALRSISQGYSENIDEVIPKKILSKVNKQIEVFNNYVDETREFSQKYNKWLGLDEYDFGDFSSIINDNWYSNIILLQERIQSTKDGILEKQLELEKNERLIEAERITFDDITSKIKSEQNRIRSLYGFRWLENEQEYIPNIGYEKLCNVTRSVIDSHNGIAIDKKVNVLIRKYQSRKLHKEIDSVLCQLPIEIQEDYNYIVFAEKTKTEKRIELEKLEYYFRVMNHLTQEEENSSDKIRCIENHTMQLVKEREALKSLAVRDYSALSKDLLDEISMKRFEHLFRVHGEDVFEYIKKRELLDIDLKNQSNLKPNEIRSEILKMKKQYDTQVNNYVKNRLAERSKVIRSNRRYRSALESIARKLTKTKRAYKTFDRLKSDPFNFSAMSAITPIWMMGLDDASRILPLEPNLFDYVILDEASQCNIAYTLPVMYRAKHAIFFGDTLQMRDSTIMFKSNTQLSSLAQKHSIPEDLQIKAEGDSVKSVMDIAKLNGFETIVLKRHYRSPIELIGFSNENFYAPKNRKLEVVNDDILATEDGRVLKTYLLEPTDKEFSPKTNLTEAYYIKTLIEKIRSNDQTKDKSIAVLSFFNEQTELLRRVITDKDIKISSIEGIQGDERDIVIFSFVITSPSPEDKRRYIALTGESGEIRKEINEGRVNVAFSRARLQVHAVTSLAPHLWPDGIWIKKYLEYIEKNGRISRLTKAEQSFDSLFEEQVYSFLVGKLDLSEYRITTQVKSCGFLIDQVITNIKSGKKLAVECDGPTHFEDGDGQVRVKNDYERQYILEVAHWDFYRISYIDWQQNKDTAKDDFLSFIDNYFLIKKLQQNEISMDHSESEVQAIYVEIPEKFYVEQIEKKVEAAKSSKNYSWNKQNNKKNKALEHKKSTEQRTTTSSEVDSDSSNLEMVKSKGLKPKERNDVFDQLSIPVDLEKIKPVANLRHKKNERDLSVLKSNEVNIVDSSESDAKLSSDNLDIILKGAGIKTIDMRSKGGALWIIGGEDLKELVEDFSKRGIKFHYKPGGGRATEGKDAWWSK